MGLNIFNRSLRISAIAIRITAIGAVAMTIGCGDGKSKKRQPVNKKPGSAQNGVKTPPASTETEADRKKKAEKLRVDGEAENRFDGTIIGLANDGQLMDKAELEEGQYKLAQFTTNLKYSGATGVMRAFRSGVIKLDSANIPKFDGEPTKSMGGAPNEPDGKGRQLEVPLSFEIKTRPFAFERTDFNEIILILTRVTSPMVKGEYKPDITVDATGIKAENITRSTTKASVVDLLRGESDSKDAKDIKYSTVDGAKKIELRLKRISDTKIRMTIEITETDLMFRTVVLDYDLVKTPAPSSAPAPAGAPASNTQTGRRDQDNAPAANGDLPAGSTANDSRNADGPAASGAPSRDDDQP